MSCFIKKTRKGIWLLVLVIFICATPAATDAENNAPNFVGQEVLTTLEQRMQKKISVDFRDTPIEAAIRMMTEQADVDIVMGPKVIGNVTATLTEIPLDEALKNILRAHDFGHILDKNMIRIAPSAEINDESEKLVDKIYQITYAEAGEVEKALQKFISSRGSLSCNPGTNHIIVSDTESKIRTIDSFIESIDRPTEQIMVEVRIYDITSKDRLDLGVEWEAGRNTSLVSGVGNNPTAGRIDPFMIGSFSGATGKTSNTTGTMRIGWLNPAIDVDAILRAQQENTNAKLLANPRILVIDNEKALFDIVTEYPYVEKTQGVTITETVKFKPVGIKLEVTPHITRDGMLRLKIKPEFGVKVGTVMVSGAAVPIIDTRKVDTIVLVKDGQTVVLGGLRKKDVTKQINKIPLLGDLPLLGGLFKFEGEDTVNSEIVVFITPWITERPVMTETEQRAYKATEFSGPKPVLTRAERPEK